MRLLLLSGDCASLRGRGFVTRLRLDKLAGRQFDEIVDYHAIAGI
jgi:hypothetical protein